MTAYTMIAVGISAHDGPPHLDPFRARDCLVNHVSKDPFTLAIKAYAMACVQVPEGADMLRDLFVQAIETDKYIYWVLPDDGSTLIILIRLVKVDLCPQFDLIHYWFNV